MKILKESGYNLNHLPVAAGKTFTTPAGLHLKVSTLKAYFNIPAQKVELHMYCQLYYTYKYNAQGNIGVAEIYDYDDSSADTFFRYWNMSKEEFLAEYQKQSGKTLREF